MVGQLSGAYRVRELHHQELLQEAARERLVRQATAGRPRWSALATARQTLGVWLILTGERLRGGSEPATAISATAGHGLV
jgi:hypothetical protein